MATSGSTDFNQTRNEIIIDAFALLGVYGVGRTVSAEDMALANNLLNKMVKAWQAQGLHLWAKEEAYLFVADNTGAYTLSSAATSARMCARDDAVITRLDGAHATSATAITVDTTVGMAAADIIGIVLDDDSVTWDTIATVDTSTTLTLTTGLDSAAASGKNVYTFTSRVEKPLRIHSMRRVEGIDSTTTTSRSEIPMIQLSHAEYFDLPMKSLNGLPSHFYYNPDILDGRLYLWPRPDSPSFYFEVTYDRMLEDLDASTDNIDFPQEWLECTTYQLAVRLAPAFGKDAKVMTMLAPMASAMLEDMKNWDQEIGSVFLVPELN